MLKAVAFCLVHRIRFVLFSKDACFCRGNGWTDYFEPFCDEVTEDFHSKLNRRTPEDPARTAFFLVFLKRKIKRILLGKGCPVSWSIYDSLFRNRLVKIRYGFNYFTYDLWEDIVHFSPSRDIKVGDLYEGSYYGLIRELNQLIWRYNRATRETVDGLVAGLSLPNYYVAMHIRGGDKVQEATIVSWEEYVSEAKRIDCKEWFIFTDDYAVVEKVESITPDHVIKTLCTPQEHGYYHHSVMTEDSLTMTGKIIRMFASVDVCKRSGFFIGTRTSNPYYVIELEHNGKNCLSLDSNWI